MSKIFQLLQIAARVNSFERISGLITATKNWDWVLNTSIGIDFFCRHWRERGGEGDELIVNRPDDAVIWTHPLTQKSFLHHFGLMYKDRNRDVREWVIDQGFAKTLSRRATPHVQLPEDSLVLHHGSPILFKREDNLFTASRDGINLATGSTRVEMESEMLLLLFSPGWWQIGIIPWPVSWERAQPKTLGIHIDYLSGVYTFYTTQFVRQLPIPHGHREKTRLVKELLSELPPWYVE